MDKLTLLARAARAAYDAECWADTNPGLARLRRRDAMALTAMARAMVEDRAKEKAAERPASSVAAPQGY